MKTKEEITQTLIIFVSGVGGACCGLFGGIISSFIALNSHVAGDPVQSGPPSLHNQALHCRLGVYVDDHCCFCMMLGVLEGGEGWPPTQSEGKSSDPISSMTVVFPVMTEAPVVPLSGST